MNEFDVRSAFTAVKDSLEECRAAGICRDGEIDRIVGRLSALLEDGLFPADGSPFHVAARRLAADLVARVRTEKHDRSQDQPWTLLATAAGALEKLLKE
jgi:hypothetical protein